MLISEFKSNHVISKILDLRFRFVEAEPYMRCDHHVRRFNVEEWCPIVERWSRILLPGTWYQNFKSDTELPVGDDKCIIRESLLEDIYNPPSAIIIRKEKHDTCYYSGDSTEMIGITALHILMERHEQGFYRPGTEPIEPKRTLEEFADSPKFFIAAEKIWESYNCELRDYRRHIDFTRLLANTLESNDYYSAVALLQSRSRYEGFEIELLTRVKMSEHAWVKDES